MCPCPPRPCGCGQSSRGGRRWGRARGRRRWRRWRWWWRATPRAPPAPTGSSCVAPQVVESLSRREVSWLTVELLASPPLDVAVEEAEVAHEEDPSHRGHDRQESPGSPRLGPRKTRRRLYWLWLTSLCERAGKNVWTNWTQRRRRQPT